MVCLSNKYFSFLKLFLATVVDDDDDNDHDDNELQNAHALTITVDFANAQKRVRWLHIAFELNWINAK